MRGFFMKIITSITCYSVNVAIFAKLLQAINIKNITAICAQTSHKNFLKSVLMQHFSKNSWFGFMLKTL